MRIIKIIIILLLFNSVVALGDIIVCPATMICTGKTYGTCTFSGNDTGFWKVIWWDNNNIGPGKYFLIGADNNPNKHQPGPNFCSYEDANGDLTGVYNTDVKFKPVNFAGSLWHIWPQGWWCANVINKKPVPIPPGLCPFGNTPF